MIPPAAPERGFKKEGGGTTESLSTMQKVIRYAEKDDLLLYITAAFGILMPAVMYFFYQHVHNRFQRNKREQKRKAKADSPDKQRKTVIFYSPGNKITKQFSYELADMLQQFDPLVAKISPKELERTRCSKTMYIFMISNQDETSQSPFAEFMDWLDELRYEHRKRSYLRSSKFAILSMNEENPCTDHLCETAKALEKRLCSLEAVPIQPIAEVQQNSTDKMETKRQFDGFCTNLNGLLSRFYYGEFDQTAPGDGSADDVTCSEESD